MSAVFTAVFIFVAWAVLGVLTISCAVVAAREPDRNKGGWLLFTIVLLILATGVTHL